MAGHAEWYETDNGESLVCVQPDGAWIWRDGKWHRNDAIAARVSGHSSSSMNYDEISRQAAEKKFPEAFKLVPG